MNSAFSGGDATQRENGSISRYEKIAVEVSRSNAAVSRFVDDDSDAVDLLCAFDPAAVARLQAVHAVAGKVEQRGGRNLSCNSFQLYFVSFTRRYRRWKIHYSAGPSNDMLGRQTK